MNRTALPHRISLRPLAGALVIAACVVVPTPVPAAPPRAVAVVMPFDDALGPYGQWVVVAQLGRVWRPHVHVVGAGFVPYLTGGHWQLTEHGWFFESGWSWGWAPFHYGRWYLDPLEGWVWVPGDVWGPAWVEWRSGEGFVGWVPLPPLGIELVFPAYRPHWCFVEARHFTHHELWQHRVEGPAAEGAYHAASPVPPSAGFVERETGTPVRTVELGPRPAPGEVRALRRPEPPLPAAPPPAPPRFERPDRRLEPQPPSEPVLPPPRRFERPADRRPEPSRPWRIEPAPVKPAPSLPVPPATPQQEDPRKKKKRPYTS